MQYRRAQAQATPTLARRRAEMIGRREAVKERRKAEKLDISKEALVRLSNRLKWQAELIRRERELSKYQTHSVWPKIMFNSRYVIGENIL